MGRLIKLTEMVLIRGVPFVDVVTMILYLMPSFFVFTIPMAFLLAVLLAFGRLSADNEITVLKSGGLSLIQLMPPVFFCALFVTILGIVTTVFVAPWGNQEFKKQAASFVGSNIASSLQEKVFWDSFPGLILYCDHYDGEKQTLKGVIIHDARDPKQPMTIFAESGHIQGGEEGTPIQFSLLSGSIHTSNSLQEYRLVNFGEYQMSISKNPEKQVPLPSEVTMSLTELNRWANDTTFFKSAPLLKPFQKKIIAEFHSRFVLPTVSIVFALIGVPLGMQNRRSGKSAGFAWSIFILLFYYIVLSVFRTIAEKGGIPVFIAMWLPNFIFAAIGGYLLWMASNERSVNIYAPLQYLKKIWRQS